jgi:hypothetical protein
MYCQYVSPVLGESWLSLGRRKEGEERGEKRRGGERKRRETRSDPEILFMCVACNVYPTPLVRRCRRRLVAVAVVLPLRNNNEMGRMLPSAAVAVAALRALANPSPRPRPTTTDGTAGLPSPGPPPMGWDTLEYRQYEGGLVVVFPGGGGGKPMKYSPGITTGGIRRKSPTASTTHRHQ